MCTAVLAQHQGMYSILFLLYFILDTFYENVYVFSSSSAGPHGNHVYTSTQGPGAFASASADGQQQNAYPTYGSGRPHQQHAYNQQYGSPHQTHFYGQPQQQAPPQQQPTPQQSMFKYFMLCHSGWEPSIKPIFYNSSIQMKGMFEMFQYSSKVAKCQSAAQLKLRRNMHHQHRQHHQHNSHRTMLSHVQRHWKKNHFNQINQFRPLHHQHRPQNKLQLNSKLIPVINNYYYYYFDYRVCVCVCLIFW